MHERLLEAQLGPQYRLITAHGRIRSLQNRSYFALLAQSFVAKGQGNQNPAEIRGVDVHLLNARRRVALDPALRRIGPEHVAKIVAVNLFWVRKQPDQVRREDSLSIASEDADLANPLLGVRPVEQHIAAPQQIRIDELRR